ncbi:hypothetical protein R3P38DRAFT_3038276 [Favolaschia claudopus]|uniref:Uncharacterized protein n=1 Tax=Favolaschia claudopus TaxID=2862362 RepID=A0AAW0ABA8_9AGAR
MGHTLDFGTVQMRTRGAYTYPSPYHPLPDVAANIPVPVPVTDTVGPGPGPAPRYGGMGGASSWWERARGEDALSGHGGALHPQTNVGAADDVDAGWADGGVGSFAAPLPAPSPSPPLKVDAGAGTPYAQPFPASSASSGHQGAGGGAHNPLSAPSAISNFSSLSGWAGDSSMVPPLSAPATTLSFHPPPVVGTSEDGFPSPEMMQMPMRTSGWYQAPGWENSLQGQGMTTEDGAWEGASSWSGPARSGYAPLPVSQVHRKPAPWAVGPAEMRDNAGGWGSASG